MKGSGFRIQFSALLFCACLSAGAAIERVDAFARLPVQEGGRIMPVDTYARMRLLQFSGRSTFSNAPASVWLARTVFTPEAARHDPVFLVNDASILIASNAETRTRFSFEQLRPSMEVLREQAEQVARIDDKERTPQQKEVARLYENLLLYFALTHSFSFADADNGITITNAAVRERMHLPAGRESFSVAEVFLRAQNLADAMQAMVVTNAATWTPEQAAVYEVSLMLYRISQVHRGLPVALMPPPDAGPWTSPWDVIGQGTHREEVRGELGLLQDLSAAYAAGDQAAFDAVATSFGRSVLARAPHSRALDHLDTELALNRLDPFYRAELLYGIAFLAGLIALASNRRWLRLATLAVVLAALVPHAGGMVARMLIMGRPPVTNLYATFLFVSFICVLLGLVVELFQKNGLGTLLASVAGLVLLLVAGRFADGDTMGVMIAVLDSNFWLATHVVCISIGYAGCFFAGLFGAAYLLAALRLAPGDARRAAIARVTYGILAFGLIFSFLGTMLGGVWADQSWGRFWGWDPKENGALLIVIWTALLFHARISRIIADTGFAAGATLGIIVVLMAWLGINLLGVGLHTYGFTNQLAVGFWSGVAIVLAFVALTLPFTKRV